MATKGKRAQASMKKRQEEVEEMRALAEKRIKFPCAKAICRSKRTLGEKERLLHVFSELPAELALERLKGALECSDQVLNALSLVFDAETFPSESLLTCTRCESEFDPRYNQWRYILRGGGGGAEGGVRPPKPPVWPGRGAGAM